MKDCTRIITVIPFCFMWFAVLSLALLLKRKEWSNFGYPVSHVGNASRWTPFHGYEISAVVLLVVPEPRTFSALRTQSDILETGQDRGPSQLPVDVLCYFSQCSYESASPHPFCGRILLQGKYHVAIQYRATCHLQTSPLSVNCHPTGTP